MLGSRSSRHTTRSHVMAVHPITPNVFTLLGSSVILSYLPETIQLLTLYPSGSLMSPFMVLIFAKSGYIQLQCIKSWVADFGSIVGKQTVLVVSLLSNYGR